MSHVPDALWLNVSPVLQGFDRPLLKQLAQHTTIAQWEYTQTLDESTDFESTLLLLHDYLQQHNQPVHLLGHSTSGLLGLLYAHKYPERVRSLTLLSVGVNPGIDWQAQYYTQRRLLPCDQHTILRHFVYGLLGCPPKDAVEALVKLLEQDLYHSLTLHSLLSSTNLIPISVDVPLLVCGSVDDIVVDPNQLRDWQGHFKHPASQLWVCPGGRHFFHYFYPKQVSQQVHCFWNSTTSSQSSACNQELINASA